MEFAAAFTIFLCDQHACHERVRLEQLISESVDMASGDLGTDSPHLRLHTLAEPLRIPCKPMANELFLKLESQMRRIGISIRLEVSKPDAGGFVCSLNVYTVPRALALAKKYSRVEDMTGLVSRLIYDQLQVGS